MNLNDMLLNLAFCLAICLLFVILDRRNRP